MPGFASHEEQRGLGRALDLSHRLGQHLRLDLAAFGIQGVETFGKRARLDGIVAGKEPRAQIRCADAAAGIDARPQDEASVIGPKRLRHARHVGERRDAGIAALPHHLEALRDERAVQARERHHVAHGAERHEIEPRHEIGLGPALVPADAAQRAVDADGEQERHADGGERAMRARLVEPVGIDHRAGIRQGRLADVMIDDDHIEPCLGSGLERGKGGDAAIDRDDDAGTFILEAEQRRRVRSIALALPVRDIDHDATARGLEKAPEQRRRGGAVDIVIAEHGDRLAPLERLDEARHGLVHVEEVRRIGQLVLETRLEKTLGRLGRDAAAREEPANELGACEALRNGKAGALVAGALAPQPPQQRALDPQYRRAGHGYGFLRKLKAIEMRGRFPRCGITMCGT